MGTLAKADRRSQRTRQLLSEALIALMRERPYEKISVQDIIERANVGRSTFYAHYAGKDGLLIASFEGLLAQLDQAWTAHARPDAVFPVAEFFHHVRQQRALYDALTWGRGGEFLFTQAHGAICRHLERRLAQWPAARQPPAIPVAVLAHSLAGALVALLRWWLDRKMPYPPEQMEAMFQALVMPGLRSALDPARPASAGA